VLPTRNRPANVRRFLASFETTATLPGTHLLLVADEDDQETVRAYLSVAGPPRLEVYGETPSILVKPRMCLQEKLNAAIIPHIAGYRAVMFLGDDCVPRTVGWDFQVLRALDELGEGIVGCNDLRHTGDLFNHAAISAGIVQALGWYANPVMGHYGIDDTWTQLGREAGCLRYLPDVVIDHLHPVWGTAPLDGLYTETMQRWWEHDTAALQKWRAGAGHDADLATVRRALVSTGGN